MENLIENIVVNVITTSGILTLMYFIVKEKIKAHITYSIKLQYDRLLEDYKNTLIQKQKATLVGELVAEWISFPEDRKRLNQLTLEAFMWLPKETTKKLSLLLSNSQDAANVRDIIEDVREIILGEEERIEASSIIIFPVDKKEKRDKKEWQ